MSRGRRPSAVWSRVLLPIWSLHFSLLLHCCDSLCTHVATSFNQKKHLRLVDNLQGRWYLVVAKSSPSFAWFCTLNQASWDKRLEFFSLYKWTRLNNVDFYTRIRLSRIFWKRISTQSLHLTINVRREQELESGTKMWHSVIWG